MMVLRYLNAKKNKWCKNDQPNLWGRPTFWLDCMVFTGCPAPKINFNPRDIGPQLSHQVTSIIVKNQFWGMHQFSSNEDQNGKTWLGETTNTNIKMINHLINHNQPFHPDLINLIHMFQVFKIEISLILSFFIASLPNKPFFHHPSRWHLASSGHHEGSGLSSAPRANIRALQQPHWKRRFDPKGILHWNPLMGKISLVNDPTEFHLRKKNVKTHGLCWKINRRWRCLCQPTLKLWKVNGVIGRHYWSSITDDP